MSSLDIDVFASHAVTQIMEDDKKCPIGRTLSTLVMKVRHPKRPIAKKGETHEIEFTQTQKLGLSHFHIIS